LSCRIVCGLLHGGHNYYYSNNVTIFLTHKNIYPVLSILKWEFNDMVDGVGARD
jgi:hypothetical protein